MRFLATEPFLKITVMPLTPPLTLMLRGEKTMTEHKAVRGRCWWGLGIKMSPQADILQACILASPLKLSVLTCCWKLNWHPVIQLRPWGTCGCTRRNRWNKMAVQRVSQCGVRTTPLVTLVSLAERPSGISLEEAGSSLHYLRRNHYWFFFLEQRLQ